jgi:hypothetical protein
LEAVVNVAEAGDEWLCGGGLMCVVGCPLGWQPLNKPALDDIVQNQVRLVKSSERVLGRWLCLAMIGMGFWMAVWLVMPILLCR